MNFHKMTNGRMRAGALLLLLGGGLLLAGCESDSVAPNEELPALTEEEAAQYAGLMAVSVAKVGPELLTFDGGKAAAKVDGIYPYTFPPGGDVSGSIVLEYLSGGAGGTHVVWDLADYGKLYTPDGEMVTVAVDLGDFEPTYSVTFDLYGPIDQEEDTATVSGTGHLTSGDRDVDFEVTDLLFEEVSTYPQGGTLEFIGDTVEILVTYDGTRYATVAIDEGETFVVDLDTGIVTPAT